MHPKMLLVFCDGTGNDSNLTDGITAPGGGLGGGGLMRPFATNVLRLSRAVKNTTSDGRLQIVFYQSGVGTEADFGENAVNHTLGIQAMGAAVVYKIRDAYAFIAQNFNEGDEICIFGFSRGAYTARKLSGFIDKIGLLEIENLGYFFEIWRQLVDGEKPNIPRGTRKTNIKCVGVWDTVGSTFNAINTLRIKDTNLPASIDVALHALSLQENRAKLLPTLWTVPLLGLASRGPNSKQLWFPGAHSDVGGGYERHELADIALFWMAGEISSFINIDLDFLRQSGQKRPEPWATSQPHNAYENLKRAEKWPMIEKTRLESGQIARDAQFHRSVLAAPTKLDIPKYMITLNTLKGKFGSNWEPDCPDLNLFEEHCIEEWGKAHIGDQYTCQFQAEAYSNFIPENAIKGGVENNGSVLYVARAPYAVHPGKASSKSGSIPWGYAEIYMKRGYEILTGTTPLKWVKVIGRFDMAQLKGAIPIR
ncbi:hypothetical protein WOLCODRAFT_133642 [Wolfiporia cocos MD-104 SS10]|uniref:T6SS Phospholipase effector Tle1-like catalytic domain-containing protein n=1 Tax=Wolfiporia cocos (strain MD-104) TaxID=742152 RepID=A0A2H3JB10_WOLCO|nr:hypothetical protein WOLCODRAFT_133642 [Wolfiporia cocos MD-104 SS10]